MRSIKLKDNNYLDTSSIVHEKENLKTLLDNNLLSKKKKYMMSSTIGWKRIAYFTNMAGGTITLYNSASYGTIAQLNFACGSGWNAYISKIFKLITNGQYFTKARIVRKGNQQSYLELYQALEYEREFVIVGVNTIHVSLYGQEVLGSVPDGYTTDEIDF